MTFNINGTVSGRGGPGGLASTRRWGVSAGVTAVVLAALLLLAGAQVASAHATVTDVEWDNPSHPTKVVATAEEEIAAIPGTYSLKVFNPSNAEVDLGDTTIDPGDATTMSVSLSPVLTSGVYRIDWATISADDGDEASGSLYLTLSGPVGGSVLLAADSAGGSPLVGWPPLAVAGAIVIGGLASTSLVLSRRRSRAS